MNRVCRRLSPALSLLAAGCLPEVEHAQVQAHLATCQVCATRLAESRLLCAALTSDAASTVPAELPSRLRPLQPAEVSFLRSGRRLGIRLPPVRFPLPRERPLFVGSLAALGAMLLVASFLVFRADRSPTASKPPSASPAYQVYVPTRQRSVLLGVSRGEVIEAGPEKRPVRRVRAIWLDDTSYVGQDRAVLHRHTTRTETIFIALDSV